MKSAPLYIDFLSGKIAYRRKHTSLRKEALVRALGLKKGMTPKIIDATGGLLRDSFVLASFGFQVTVLERSSVIYALLCDGMARAMHDPEIALIMQRLQLIQADAIEWLKQLKPADYPDIIYLDPMFPMRQKTALVKKEMRIFHEIIGDDLDSDTLLNAALACASKRVVVKRPRLAAPLANLAPAFSLTGSSSRFDVYLTSI